MTGVILETINSPSDLRKLPVSDLDELVAEVRHYIVDTLATHPGHLASSLGTVELTVALHYVFNTPDDKIVFDVGHQAYSHKIITGRRDQFPTIRTYGGLSGFPKMDESEYDAFGTGHSSTSISAVLGMATASKLQGQNSRQHIAVIGDGSMTGGEAFEALNNAGDSKANVLVILNDNGISIDKSVGGLSRYLTKISSSSRYNNLKERMWMQAGGDERDTKMKSFFSRLLSSVKKLFMPKSANLFEALGFRYFGPIDGHNTEELVDVLQHLKKINGPRLLHIVTKKGKGMPLAERNPIAYHAPGKFDAETGKRIAGVSPEAQPLKYQDVFGHTIIELAEQNQRIVGITPAMPTGCSLNMMMEKMPHRAFDVGIAEQHAVTFSAGLAAQGMVPFCNIYSSFMQRAFDQVVHDVALQRLPVVICLDRAGLVGDDGPTHHGVFDLACLRPVPNLTICAPMNDHELRHMMYTASKGNSGSWVIRYPRGLSVNADWQCPMHEIAIGKGRTIREPESATTAILTIGHIGNLALQAVERLKSEENIEVGLYDMRFVKPIDTELLVRIASRYKRIVTIEDGVIEGGFGSAVLEQVGDRIPVVMMGVPDRFIPHGSIPQLQKECGLDVDSIMAAARG